MLLGMRTKNETNGKPKRKPARKAQSPHKTRDEIFAYEYVINGGNASLAAKKAGSNAKNLSVAGCDFLGKPEVVAMITNLRVKLQEELHVTAKEIIGSLLLTSRSTMADCVDEDGYFDWEKARLTGAVNQLKKVHIETKEIVNKKGEVVGRLTITKAEMYSKMDANKQLAQMLGLQQSPKANEYDTVCNAVKIYMTEKGCTLKQAVDELSIQFPIVSKYSAQILESGLV